MVIHEGTHGCNHTTELKTSEQLYFTELISLLLCPKLPKRLSLLFFNRLRQMASPDLGAVRYLGSSQVKNGEGHGSKGRAGFMPGNKLDVKR